MKAVLCKKLGPPEDLVVEDIPSLVPNAGQVVVAVKAAGVNFPDTLIIQGKYQFKPEPPFSPGGEVAGVVKELGANVTGVKVGDRVIAAATFGGFAEEMLCDADRLTPIPDSMDFVPASAFLLTYGTSYHALKDRAHLKPGETLLVLGASGGVGLAAVQLGKAMGARVIAAASSDAKLDVCRQNGADDVINYASDDLRSRVKALTAGTVGAPGMLKPNSSQRGSMSSSRCDNSLHKPESRLRNASTFASRNCTFDSISAQRELIASCADCSAISRVLASAAVIPTVSFSCVGFSEK